MGGANSFGSRLQITTFGESHGPAMGVVVDGMPAGVPFDIEFLMSELARRRPGSADQAGVVSERKEPDTPEVLSGVFENKTLGTPIAIVIRNVDARPQDYKAIPDGGRLGHADDVWKKKFGHSDPRGGGRASGRETVSRVAAGAIAQMLLKQLCPGCRVYGFASQIGSLTLNKQDYLEIKKRFQSANPPMPSQYFDKFPARFPSVLQQSQVTQLLSEAKTQGKSYGGIAQIWIENAPENLGEPVFHKMKAELTAAFMSVGAVSAVEIGAGFEATASEGTQFHVPGSVGYGGIRGGITTGERITARVGFKPTSSVNDIAKQGRHDPCIVTRAIPVLEAMANLVLADHMLWRRSDTV